MSGGLKNLALKKMILIQVIFIFLAGLYSEPLNAYEKRSWFEILNDPRYEELILIKDAGLNGYARRLCDEAFDYIESSPPERPGQITKRPEKFVVKVVNDPSFNAFVFQKDGCMYMYVHRGLLEFVRSEDAIVSIIEHELSHYVNGDINESKEGQSKFDSMKYSQTQEKQADEGSTTRMSKRGYNPYESIRLWYDLYGKFGDNPSILGSIFSTHPNPSVRAQALEDIVKRMRRAGIIDIDKDSESRKPLGYKKSDLKKLNPLRDAFEEEYKKICESIERKDSRENTEERDKLERLKLLKDYFERVYKITKELKFTLEDDFLRKEAYETVRGIRDPYLLREAWEVARDIDRLSYTYLYDNRDKNWYTRNDRSPHNHNYSFPEEFYEGWYRNEFAEYIEAFPPPEHLWDDLSGFTRFLKEVDEKTSRFFTREEMAFLSNLKPDYEQNSEDVKRMLKRIYLQQSTASWIRFLPQNYAEKYILRYYDDCKSPEDLQLLRDFLNYESSSIRDVFNVRQAYFKALSDKPKEFMDNAFESIYRNEYADKKPFQLGDYTEPKYTVATLNKYLERSAMLLSWREFIDLVDGKSINTTKINTERITFLENIEVRHSLLRSLKNHIGVELVSKDPESVLEGIRVDMARFEGVLIASSIRGFNPHAGAIFTTFENGVRKMILEEFAGKISDEVIARKFIGSIKQKLSWMLERAGSISEAILAVYPYLPGGKVYAEGESQMHESEHMVDVYNFIEEGAQTGKYTYEDIFRATTIYIDDLMINGASGEPFIDIVEDISKTFNDLETSHRYIKEILDWLGFNTKIYHLASRLTEHITDYRDKGPATLILRKLTAVLLGEEKADILPEDYREKAVLAREICAKNPQFRRRVEILLREPLGVGPEAAKNVPYYMHHEDHDWWRMQVFVRDKNFDTLRRAFELRLDEFKKINDPRERYGKVLEFFRIKEMRLGMYVFSKPGHIGYLYEVFTQKLNIPMEIVAQFVANNSEDMIKEYDGVAPPDGSERKNPFEDALLIRDREKFADFQKRYVKSLPTVGQKLQALVDLMPSGAVGTGFLPVKGEKSVQASTLETLNGIAESIVSKADFDLFMEKYTDIVREVFNRLSADMPNSPGLPEDIALSKVHDTVWRKYKEIPGINKSISSDEMFMRMVRLDPLNWTNKTVPSSRSDEILTEEIIPKLNQTPDGRKRLGGMLDLRHPKRNEPNGQYYKFKPIILDSETRMEVVKGQMLSEYSGSFRLGMDFILNTYTSPSTMRDKLLLWWGSRFEITRQETEDLYKKTTHVEKSSGSETDSRIFDNIFNKLNSTERVDLLMWLNDIETLDRSKSFVVKIEADLDETEKTNAIPKRTMEHIKLMYKNENVEGRQALCHKVLLGEQSMPSSNITILETLSDPEANERFRVLFGSPQEYPEGSEFLANFLRSYFDALDAIDKRAFVARTIADFSDLRHTPERLLVKVLQDMGIVGAKVAQVLGSARGYLPESYIEALLDFRDKVQSPFKYEVMKWLDGYFGSPAWEKVFTLGNELGAGSVAVVYEGSLTYFDEEGVVKTKKVAIKIKREAVEARIKYDIKLLEEIIDELSINGFKKYADALRAAVRETKRMLDQEVKYREETRSNIELKDQSLNDERISTEYVDMETEEGIREKTDIEKLAGDERIKRLFDNIIIQDVATGESLNDFIREQIKNSSERTGLMNALGKIIESNLVEMLVYRATDSDPQSGNYKIDPVTGKLKRLDAGQKYELTEGQCESIIRFLAALGMADGKMAAEHWVEMTEGTPENKERAKAQIEKWVTRNRNLPTIQLYRDIQALSGKYMLTRTNELYAATKQLGYLYEYSGQIENFNNGVEEIFRHKNLEAYFRDIVEKHYPDIYSELRRRGVSVKARHALERVKEFFTGSEEETDEREAAEENKKPEVKEDVVEKVKPGSEPQQDVSITANENDRGVFEKTWGMLTSIFKSDSDVEVKPDKTEGKADKPEGLPRTQLTVDDAFQADIDADKLNKYRKVWEEKAREAGLGLEIVNKSSAEFSGQDFDPRYLSYTRVEGGKIIVTLYSTADVVLRHEGKVLEAAAMAPDLFRSIQGINIETSKEIIDELSTGNKTPKKLLQLMLINLIELEGTRECLRGELNESDAGILEAEKFERVMIHKRLASELGWKNMEFSLPRIYEIYRSETGKPSVREALTYKERVARAVNQRYQSKSLVRAFGAETLQLGVSVLEFLPAVFMADVVISIIESSGTMSIGEILDEFMGKLSTKEFWMEYGYFHGSGVALDMLAIDELMAEKIARVFSKSADPAYLKGLERMLRPSLKMASVFVIVNGIHNLSSAMDVLKDGSLNSTQKTFKFVEIMATQGWLKVGVDVGVFLAVPAVLQAIGFTGGPVVGVITLAASMVAVHLVGYIYDALENTYRKMQIGAHEEDIKERLMAGENFSEMEDNIRDCLKEGVCSLVDQSRVTDLIVEVHEFISMAWGELTGESPGIAAGLEDSLEWHFSQWSHFNDLKRMKTSQKVASKIAGLDEWNEGERRKINNKYTGSYGYMALLEKTAGKNDGYDDSYFRGLVAYDCLLSGYNFPLNSKDMKTSTATANLDSIVYPLTWEAKIKAARESYDYLTRKVREESGLKEATSQNGDDEKLLVRIQDIEAKKLGELERRYHVKWYEDVRPQVFDKIPAIIEDISNEEKKIEGFLGLSNGNEAFASLAGARLIKLKEARDYYKNILEEATKESKFNQKPEYAPKYKPQVPAGADRKGSQLLYH